jgi:serpin B
MLRLLIGDDKNRIIAPTSLAAVLGMLCVGAKGGTQQEILDILTNTKYQSVEMDGGVMAFASELQSLDACGGAVRANNIYVKDTINRVLAEFKDSMRELFVTDFETLPFASDPEYCENVINRWISKKTNGRITQLVRKETMDKDTLLIAVSALVFDGLWLHPFEKRHEKMTFNTLDRRCVATDVMACSAYFKMLYTPDFSAVEIPYEKPAS